MHGRGAVLAALIAVVIGAGAVGCDDEPDSPRAYQIVDIDVDVDGDDDRWLPDQRRVQMWFTSAVGDNQGLVSTNNDGEPMRATLTQRMRHHNDGVSTRLVVAVEAELSRVAVSDNDTAITLQARSSADKVLAAAEPADRQLHQTGRALTVEAVETAAEKLELRARLRHWGNRQLLEWIGDDTTDTRRRMVAIDWLIDGQVGIDDRRLRPVLADATATDDDDVAVTAARAMVHLDLDNAAHVLMDRAQSASRHGDYDRYLRLVPLLDELDEEWISIYLHTVADAHAQPRVRSEVRSVVGDDDPPPAHF